MKRARKLKAIRNEARGTWVFFPVINGKRTTRKLGTLKELTQELADKRAEEMMRSLKLRAERNAPSVSSVVEQYREEKMPRLRHSTQRVTGLWIKNYVLVRWGKLAITDLQPRPVEQWLESLPLAPKTRGHLRELLHRLVEYAMWCGSIPFGTNPISLVTVHGFSKRMRQPRSLKLEEFHSLLKHLDEPFRTMARVQLCLGLRVSELLALRWNDVDWVNSKLNVEHGIVNQRLDSVKTEGSREVMHLDPELLLLLTDWKRQTSFQDPTDWVFSSPVKLGRLPYSYTGYRRALNRAAAAAGLGRLGTHSFRHTYRSWLDAVGTAISVQQRLMRHSNIQITMNTYGAVVTDEMQVAGSKVAKLALRSDSKLIPAVASH